MSAHYDHAAKGASGRPNAPMHTVGRGGNPRTMVFGMAAVALGFYGFWRLQFSTQDRRHTSPDAAEMPTWQFRHAQQTPEFNERVSSPGGTGTNLRPRGSSAQEPAGAQYAHARPVGGDGAGGGAASSGMVGVGSRDGSRRGLESAGANERGGESTNRSGKNGEDGKSGSESSGDGGGVRDSTMVAPVKSEGADDPRGKDNHAQRRGEESHPVRNAVATVMTALHGDPREANQNSNGHVGEPAAPRRLNDRGGIYTKNSDYKDSYRRD
ncbi:hypothetical protein OH77DRAFT_1589513 [Trametes cingulata]|nr:hypothetical protein OH77DRAFT_1589513 [Trametes cingulata]